MTPVALVEAIVKSRAAYVNIDEAAIRRFANDLVAQNERVPRLDRRVLAVAPRLNGVFLTKWLRRVMPTRIQRGFDTLERTVITEFLIAVGFFRAEKIDGQAFHYDGLPRRGINVFARFD
jgi:hypothetical protein